MKRFHSVTAFSIRFDFEKPQWVPSRQRSICEAATDSIAAWANLDLFRDPAPSGASLLSTTPPPLLFCFIVNIDQGRMERLVSWKGWADSGEQHISVYGNDQASYAIINLHRSLVIWYFIHLRRFFSPSQQGFISSVRAPGQRLSPTPGNYQASCLLNDANSSNAANSFLTTHWLLSRICVCVCVHVCTCAFL